MGGDDKMSDKQILLPSTAGWYGATEVGSRVYVMDGSRPRLLERKPLLVGEWLPRSGEEPHGPLSVPARVLCVILGITYETFLCLFDRLNILKRWTEGKPPRASTLRVMASDLGFSGVPIILLGRSVCQALEFPLTNYIWGELDKIPTIAVPHPRGEDPAYDDVNERLRVRKILERTLLYHGRIFKIGDWPDGNGSLVMVDGEAWGDAARRLKHKTKTGAEK